MYVFCYNNYESQLNSLFTTLAPLSRCRHMNNSNKYNELNLAVRLIRK